jgi:hypothetical protein
VGIEPATASDMQVSPNPAYGAAATEVIVPLSAVGTFVADLNSIAVGANLDTAFSTIRWGVQLKRDNGTADVVEISQSSTATQLRLYADLATSTTAFKHYANTADAAETELFDTKYLIHGGVRVTTVTVSESSDYLRVDDTIIVKDAESYSPSDPSSVTMTEMTATDLFGYSSVDMKATEGTIDWYRKPVLTIPGSSLALASSDTSDATVATSGTDYVWTISGFQYQYGRIASGVAIRDDLTISSVAVTSISNNGSGVALFTADSHGFSVGDAVSFIAASSHGDTSYDGTYVVATVPSTSTFTLQTDVDDVTTLAFGSANITGVASGASTILNSSNESISDNVTVSFASLNASNGSSGSYSPSSTSLTLTVDQTWADNNLLNGSTIYLRVKVPVSSISQTNMGGQDSSVLWGKTADAVISLGFSSVSWNLGDSSSAILTNWAPYNGFATLSTDSAAETYQMETAFTSSGHGSFTVTGVTDSSGDALYTADEDHNLSVGDSVTVSGVSSAYNITAGKVVSVPSSTTFTLRNVNYESTVSGASGTGVRYSSAIFGDKSVLATSESTTITGLANGTSWKLAALPTLDRTAGDGDDFVFVETPATIIGYVITGTDLQVTCSGAHKLQVGDVIILTNGPYKNTEETTYTITSISGTSGSEEVFNITVSGDAGTLVSGTEIISLSISDITHTRLDNFKSSAFSFNWNGEGAATSVSKTVDSGDSTTTSANLSISLTTTDDRFQTGQEFILQFTSSSTTGAPASLRRRVMLRAPGDMPTFNITKLATTSYMDSLTLTWDGSAPSTSSSGSAAYVMDVRIEKDSQGDWYRIMSGTDSLANIIARMVNLPERWLDVGADSSLTPHSSDALITGIGSTNVYALTYRLGLANPAGTQTHEESFEAGDADITLSYRYASFTTSRGSELMNNTVSNVIRASHNGGGILFRTAVSDGSGVDVSVYRSIMKRRQVTLGSDVLYSFMPISTETITPASGEDASAERTANILTGNLDTAEGVYMA